MTRVLNDGSDGGPRVVLIETDPNEAPCELCGTVAELRPYGPNDENICYDCGMKDEDTTTQKLFQKLLGDKQFGDGSVLVHAGDATLVV